MKRYIIAHRAFIKYLKDRGSSTFSGVGNKSTVFNYAARVERICNRENYKTLDELEQNIEEVVSKYSSGGIEAEYGAQSHGSNLKALELFKEFCEMLDTCLAKRT